MTSLLDPTTIIIGWAPSLIEFISMVVFAFWWLLAIGIAGGVLAIVAAIVFTMLSSQ
jgi:hypothetical protein